MVCISRLHLQWYHILIILPANSMTTWILHYRPTHCSSVLFRSLHYYKPALIILARKSDVVVVTFFLLLQQWFSTISLKEPNPDLRLC